MSKSTVCPSCAHVHDSSWTIAVGRFDTSVQTTYRATYPDSTIWRTRRLAELDMCAHLRGRDRPPCPPRSEGDKLHCPDCSGAALDFVL